MKKTYLRNYQNLSDEAIEILASGMVERVVKNRLTTEREKQERLFQMMKGG